ncbi:FAD-dependent oxidoreductase [Pelagibacteraceae bacterium]|nr:FAD-dependent oxidoreductase [Pelagibacteraceae bacterium]MDC0937771.1 FAD-dependent oxidoreductase [Pelagibacteraceae bacterium]
MKIAVIGSGISGLSAAYFLSKHHKVDLFEQNDHFGGHSYTYEIREKDKIVPVDLGFIVFNELTYPNLINFFNELDVPFEKSNMSFSVSVKKTNVEYGGSGLNAIFANKLNLLNFKFLKMIREIINFYNYAPSLLESTKEETLGGYLERSKLSKYFIEYHIIPMVAAIWSMPFSKAKEMPLKLFLNFFVNHGLFKLKNRPQWYTVTNRSRAYVKKVLKKISGEIFKNYKINNISRNEDNVRVSIGNEYLDYDQVVLACHANQSLNILDDPTEKEKEILNKFTYVRNAAFLHTDTNLMPLRKKAWSSWNSITKDNRTCVTYWLNKLQNLKTDKNYFLTLNPVEKIEENKVIKQEQFTHPYFNNENVNSQKDLHLLQGRKRTWFCGSYFGYGFHEDGLKSSIELIKNFKAQ